MPYSTHHFVMHVLYDIPYTTHTAHDPLRIFDLYLPLPSETGSLTPLICFVHGGAWRTEDKSDHALLAKKLVHSVGLPVAVPNYRLSPLKEPEDMIFQHPSHAEDILQFLEFLLAWDGPSDRGQVYNKSKLFLMGHSCGAHMLSSIILDSSGVTPSLTPSPALLNAVKGVVASEGIYDLDLLLAAFPKYLDWFIAAAFGRHESYHTFAVTKYRTRRSGIRWLIVQSQGDTLIDVTQSKNMLEHLKLEYGQSAIESISYDTSLTQEHDDILVTDEFVNSVKNFIAGSL